MVIYYYEKSQSYSAKDTDRLIVSSLQAYGNTTEPMCVLRTKEGKPYVSAEGLFVGVSHTASLVLVAVAPYDFGIDIERCDRTLCQLEKLMEKYCTAEEKASIIKISSAEWPERFLTLWTKKEALLKYRGIGLADLKNADTTAVSGHFHTIRRGSYIVTVYAEDPVQRIEEKNIDGVCFE